MPVVAVMERKARQVLAILLMLGDWRFSRGCRGAYTRISWKGGSAALFPKPENRGFLRHVLVNLRLLSRYSLRKHRGSLTLMAIPTSGGPPKSITVPCLALRVGLPIAVGLAVLLVGSYVHVTRDMVQLTRAKQSQGMAMEELLRENELLKEEKDDRITQLKELTERAEKLAAAVHDVVGENSRIWEIVKGSGSAKSTSSSSSSTVRGTTSRGGDLGADRGEPVIGSALAAGSGCEEEIDAGAVQEEDELAIAASEALARLSELTSATQKDMSSLRSRATKYQDKLNRTPSIAPAKGKIVSGYGNRLHPILRVTRFHEGVDIAAPRGTPIMATADGVVTRAGWLGSYGNVVEISHGYGITTLYAHNSRNAVKTGAAVKRGQAIAYVGSTGLSTGAHVHYEVRVDKRPVNPSSYMK